MQLPGCLVEAPAAGVAGGGKIWCVVCSWNVGSWGQHCCLRESESCWTVCVCKQAAVNAAEELWLSVHMRLKQLEPVSGAVPRRGVQAMGACAGASCNCAVVAD